MSFNPNVTSSPTNHETPSSSLNCEENQKKECKITSQALNVFKEQNQAPSRLERLANYVGKRLEEPGKATTLNGLLELELKMGKLL